MPKYGKRFKKILKEARKQPSYWAEEIRLDFMSELAEEMERQGVSQAELSRRLKKSPAYISKVFNADVGNFTLETLAEFSMALDMKVNIGLEPISTTVPNWNKQSTYNIKKESEPVTNYDPDFSNFREVEFAICAEDLAKIEQEEKYGKGSTSSYLRAA